MCPICETPVPPGHAICPSCGGAMLLHGRFALERLLGAGGQSRVFAARDEQTGQAVAVKILSLARVHDPKTIELFRRAAGVLAGLSHPAIPRTVEYFEEHRPGEALFCLVHELIDGETLAEAGKRGERWDEAAVIAMAREVLGVLGYLHQLSPPIIHRDLKPSNLMRRRDGQLVLIDFDLVRDALRPEGGSTMSAGTPGYAPPEQFLGDATPATDLYALGATLVTVLARKTPIEMGHQGQRIDFHGHVRVRKRLLAILDRLLEPDPGKRYQSAAQVIEALDRLDAPDPAPAPVPVPAHPGVRAGGHDRKQLSTRARVLTAVGSTFALLVCTAVVLMIQDPTMRPWIERTETVEYVGDASVVETQGGWVLFTVERVTYQQFLGHGQLWRLSVFDASSGALRARVLLGKVRPDIVGRGPGMVWLNDEVKGCNLSAYDAGTARRLIDQAGIAAKNGGAHLLFNGCSAEFDETTGELYTQSADGYEYAVAPLTWTARVVDKESRPRTSSRAAGSLTSYGARNDQTGWTLTDCPRCRLAPAYDATPGSDVFLGGSFLRGGGQRFVFTDPESELVLHESTLGRDGIRQLSRVGRDGRALWTWSDPSFVAATGSPFDGVFLTAPSLILGGQDAAKRPLAVAVDCATGRERWRHVF